ncbi:MAG: hypothetical protein ABSG03_21525 [Bryobacteraceae bacterium]
MPPVAPAVSPPVAPAVSPLVAPAVSPLVAPAVFAAGVFVAANQPCLPA